MNMHVKAWGVTVCRPAFEAADTTRCNADKTRCEWTFKSDTGKTKAKADYADLGDKGDVLFLTLHYSYGDEDLGSSIYVAGDVVANKTANGDIVFDLKGPLTEIASDAHPPSSVRPRKKKWKKKKAKWKKKKKAKWGRPKAYIDKFVAPTPDEPSELEPVADYDALAALVKANAGVEDRQDEPTYTREEVPDESMRTLGGGVAWGPKPMVMLDNVMAPGPVMNAEGLAAEK